MISQTVTPSIIALGTAVPPHKISQQQHYSILESANGLDRAGKLILRKIYNNSGIDSRHSVLGEFGNEESASNLIFHPSGEHVNASMSSRMKLFEKYAADLCIDAIQDCVKQQPIDVLKKITHLITFSCTGMSAPGIDIEIIERLNLNRNVERTCINFMGCYAGINALKIASYIVRAQPGVVVLVTGVELCTIHYQKNNTQDQTIANALFADGAAAALVGSSNDALTPSMQLSGFYSEFEPSGINEMAWRIGDYGFDIRLSTYVPDLIEENISELLRKLLMKAGLTAGEIDWYALHPGGVKILEACEKALGIPHERNKFSYDVLREYGNMSSVTVFFVLRKYLEAVTAADKGKKILSCGFGPGLTMESMLLKVN